MNARSVAALLVAAFTAPAVLASDTQIESAAQVLAQRWQGVYDTLEQPLYDERGLTPLAQAGNLRVRTIVTPVSLPWLGANVLYLEEFAHEDPESPRRQVLLRLASDSSSGTEAVRVRQYTLRDPARWRSLPEDREQLHALRLRDLESIAGCDLLLRREGEQFRGGTVGRSCIASSGDPASYVDYRLLVGGELYWYHKRVLRGADEELLQEIAGFDWFELHEARLFACRVRFPSAPGATAPPSLTIVNVHDQGGRARFTTPDGKGFELQLHSRDLPFDANRDALLLIVRELADAGATLASSWTQYDAEQIGVDVGAMDVRCGPIAPNRTAMAF
jgi:hypothetical protein